MITNTPPKTQCTLIILVLSILPWATGCGTADSTASRSTDIQALTGDATTGQTLYTSNCSTCHGTDGQSGTASKNITGQGTSDIISTVLTGKGSMPSFSDLSDQEIADLTAYVDSL